MTEILAIFRSRSQAVDCYGKMKAAGIPAQLINTPDRANVGCGLSVKFPQSSATKARGVISRAAYSAFYGYLKIDRKEGRYYFK